MTCKFDDVGACAPMLGKRVTFGAAASIMATLVVASVGLLFSAPGSAAEIKADKASVERGRYLVQIGGCNDCHTAGYAETAGNVPQSEWLMGSPLGFKGEWGTSYAANLRLTVDGLTEDQWVTFARVPRRPPMPWFNLRDMSDGDLRAMYRFVRELGPKGERAPPAAAPGVVVKTPVIVFEPRIETTASNATR
jgi:mono/diheme cytochrome c family protein